MSIKGYKVFNPDWTCHDFQYEVGKTYEYDGEISLCNSGFHFCERIGDCFSYYSFDSKNKVAEVEATGNIETGLDKSVTNKITIIREISWQEVLNKVNIGADCTGLKNTGNSNSGSWNTGEANVGDRNSGSHNFGQYNTGYGNIGSRNSGHYNTKSCNSGDYNNGVGNAGFANFGWNNTGNYNLGSRNTGDWNSCDNSTGFFNTIEQPTYAFNKPLNISRKKFLQCAGVKILHEAYKIYLMDLFQNSPYDAEKLKQIISRDFQNELQNVWDMLAESKKQKVKEIPNFDAEIFKEITGIDVNK